MNEERLRHCAPCGEDGRGCRLCPRACGADRGKGFGYCGASSRIRVARAALHFYEEPCLVGDGGAGTVFFCGCPLHCVYCQNAAISRGGKEAPGREIDGEALRRICFSLKEQGAVNLDLVTPLHYAVQVREALLPVKEKLGVPIVCNTGGYDSPAQIAAFDGLADVYLPDYKYAPSASALAAAYSGTPDYAEVAERAIAAMLEQVGRPVFGKDGLLKKGVLVRHLVLPGHRKESIAALHRLRERFSPEDILLSLMSQYTPIDGMVPPLNRRVTTFEYQSVLDTAAELGFQGYGQQRSSAEKTYTPAFDLTGL